MSWVRLDDQFADHPKIVGLSNAAFRLHVHALCYAASQLTDGFLSAAAIRRLAWASDDPQADVQALLDAGAWEITLGGYRIHDYLDYNPSRETVRATRKARAAAGARGGAAKAQRDPGKPLANEAAKTKRKPAPSPSPSPSPGREPGPRGAAAPPAAVASPASGSEGRAAAPPAPMAITGPAANASVRATGQSPPHAGGRARAPRHPLAALYHQHMGVYPNAVQETEIIAQVADSTLFARCLRAWRLAGHSPVNAAGVLDWYRAGGPPDRSHPSGRRGASPPLSPANHAAAWGVCPRCSSRPCRCDGSSSDAPDELAALRSAWNDLAPHVRAVGLLDFFQGARPTGRDDQGRLILEPTERMRRVLTEGRVAAQGRIAGLLARAASVGVVVEGSPA